MVLMESLKLQVYHQQNKMTNKYYNKLREIELKKNPTKEDKKLFPLLHWVIFGFKESSYSIKS